MKIYGIYSPITKCFHIHLSGAGKKLISIRSGISLLCSDGASVQIVYQRYFPISQGDEEQILHREINEKGTFYCGMKNDSNILSFNNWSEFRKVVWCDILEGASGQMCVAGAIVFENTTFWSYVTLIWANHTLCQITECSRIAEKSLHKPRDAMYYAVGQDVWSTSEFHLNFNEVNLIVFTLEQHLKVQQSHTAHKYTEAWSTLTCLCLWTPLCPQKEEYFNALLKINLCTSYELCLTQRPFFLNCQTRT